MPQPSKDFTLRPAVPTDAERIRWLEEVSMKDLAIAIWGQWQPSATVDLSSHEMIERNGAVIGCMATREDADALYLTRLYLAPTARNQGIGADCVTEVITRARALGVPVRLRALVNNPAIRFYERHGFLIEERTDTHVYMSHPNQSNQGARP